MSRILHPVHNLPAPYLMVDQRVFDIEPGGHVRVPPASHFRMVVVREGEMALRSKDRGKEFLGVVQSGDVLIAPRQAEYSYHPSRPKSYSRLHVIRILWDPKHLAAGPNGPELPPGDRASAGCRRLARVASSLRVVPVFRDPRQNPDWMASLLAECAKNRPGRERMIAALLDQLEVLLERQLAVDISSEEASTPDRSAYLASRTREILSERLEHPWSLDELAWQMRVSGEHLARAFRRATGTTVFTELARMRIERARELLLTTELSVGEIARQVGIPDPTIFGRVFRRLEGYSPSSFRDRERAAMVFIPRSRPVSY